MTVINAEKPPPENECDLRLSVIDITDTTEKIGWNLYDKHVAECAERGERPHEREYGHMYEMNNGVWFRIYACDFPPTQFRLEFMAGDGHDKEETLPKVAGMLQKAGVTDRQMLGMFKAFLEEKRAYIFDGEALAKQMAARN